MKKLILGLVVLFLAGMTYAQNTATTSQTGNDNSSTTGQTGSNIATTTQVGDWNNSDITQNRLDA